MRDELRFYNKAAVVRVEYDDGRGPVAEVQPDLHAAPDGRIAHPRT
jgi:hypothetical protein